MTKKRKIIKLTGWIYGKDPFLVWSDQKEEFSHVNLSQIFKVKGDHNKTKVCISIEVINGL